MVLYTLVPDSDGSVHSSHRSRCPKLACSRSRIIPFLVISILVLVVFILTFAGSSTWTFARNVTECPVDTKCRSGRKSARIGSTHSKGEKRLYIKRFPQALIIGARKGGTRALLRFLNIHQDVIVSKHEAHYFDRNYKNDYDWYLDQMPESYPGQITMEKTPNYFVASNVPERVFVYNASIKLLLILRNPIDRAMSDFLQLKIKENRSNQVPSFEKLVLDPETGEVNASYGPIDRSLYCTHLQKWLAYFDVSQILIIDGENIKVRPWEEMHRVEEFLGVSHQLKESRFIFNETKGFYCFLVKRPHSPWQTVQRCLAPGKGRQHPVIDPIVQRKLEKFFRPYNERLFAKIGRSFDWF